MEVALVYLVDHGSLQTPDQHLIFCSCSLSFCSCIVLCVSCDSMCISVCRRLLWLSVTISLWICDLVYCDYKLLVELILLCLCDWIYSIMTLSLKFVWTTNSSDIQIGSIYVSRDFRVTLGFIYYRPYVFFIFHVINFFGTLSSFILWFLCGFIITYGIFSS